MKWKRYTYDKEYIIGLYLHLLFPIKQKQNWFNWVENRVKDELPLKKASSDIFYISGRLHRGIEPIKTDNH